MNSPRSFMRPADWGRRLRPNGPESRLLLVEPNSRVASVFSALFTWHRIGAPECAATGDEALDLIGAARQRYDLVLMAMPLCDECEVDVTAVLRDNRSPVRLTRYGALRADDCPSARGMQGTASVFELLDWRGLARHAADVLAAPVSVGTIMERKTAPDTLSIRWAEAIYGARPGDRFKPILH